MKVIHLFLIKYKLSTSTGLHCYPVYNVVLIKQVLARPWKDDAIVTKPLQWHNMATWCHCFDTVNNHQFLQAQSGTFGGIFGHKRNRKLIYLFLVG